MRTPMQWEDRPGGGFTAPGVQPWLPLGDLGGYNVEAQRGDPDSILGLTRDLIALRRSVPDLQRGSYATLGTTPGAWAWGRGDHVVVLAGMSEGDAGLDDVSGTVILATDGRRRGERVEGRLSVHGWEAVVVERAVVVDGRRGIERLTATADRRGSRRSGRGVALAQPLETAGQVAEVVRGLPGMGEVAERGGKDPAVAFGEAPRQRVGGAGAGCRATVTAELVRPGRQQHPGIGTEVAELVHLVVPRPGRIRGGPRPGGPARGRPGCTSGSRDGRRIGPRPPSRTRPTRNRRRWPSARPAPRCDRNAAPPAARPVASGAHGVSPMVNRLTTRASARTAGSRVRTSVTRWKLSPAASANWAMAVADWSSTPWTPAGPCWYGATWVT